MRQAFKNYEIYNIYFLSAAVHSADHTIEIVEITEDLCREADDPEIQSLAGYATAEAKGYGLLDEGRLVCACWYWYGVHYARMRGFWPLGDRDAKLVQITTASSARGRSLARHLIAASSQAMAAEGFQGLFARIWFGHKASERAFEAAGWRRIATVLTLQPRLGHRTLRFEWPPWRSKRPAPAGRRPVSSPRAP